MRERDSVKLLASELMDNKVVIIINKMEKQNMKQQVKLILILNEEDQQ